MYVNIPYMDGMGTEIGNWQIRRNQYDSRRMVVPVFLPFSQVLGAISNPKYFEHTRATPPAVTGVNLYMVPFRYQNKVRWFQIEFLHDSWITTQAGNHGKGRINRMDIYNMNSNVLRHIRHNTLKINSLSACIIVVQTNFTHMDLFPDRRFPKVFTTKRGLVTNLYMWGLNSLYWG